MTTEVEDPMTMPELTYCPGFRQDYVEEFGMKLKPFENHYFTFFPNEKGRTFAQYPCM